MMEPFFIFIYLIFLLKVDHSLKLIFQKDILWTVIIEWPSNTQAYVTTLNQTLHTFVDLQNYN